MIPGKTYYWELESDSNVYGLVKASGKRRNIYSSVRNVRDLGGMSVSYTDSEGTKSGKLKYGILFRGSKINSTSDANELSKLGINEELDLRESNSDKRVGTYKNYEIINYIFDRSAGEKAAFRDALTVAMQDVVGGKNIYFHCKIGTDRTGTLAYLLEGLLGVKQEQMLEDYELSYFFGLVNRHRFYAEDPNSSVSKTQKFVYMYDIMSDHNEVKAVSDDFRTMSLTGFIFRADRLPDDCEV
jgi:protein tyrosine phosphatase